MVSPTLDEVAACWGFITLTRRTPEGCEEVLVPPNVNEQFSGGDLLVRGRISQPNPRHSGLQSACALISAPVISSGSVVSVSACSLSSDETHLMRSGILSRSQRATESVRAPDRLVKALPAERRRGSTVIYRRAIQPRVKLSQLKTA